MKFVIALMAVAWPGVGFADITGTKILTTGTALNLDSGTTAARGGDILWNGSTITPQGSATAANIGNLGQAGYNAYSETLLKPFKILAGTRAIAASVLVAGDVFAVFTNGGNIAKVLVTANSGGSITLQFTSYGSASTTPGGPSIKEILNNSSHVPAGYPNYGIAPSSLFIVTGNNLSDPGAPVLQSSSPPGLPTTLNGTSIAVTVNGVTTHPPLYYTSPTQIAAVLPASTPVGTGTLTVTYQGVASSAAPIQVVASALGINTYNNAGIATDAITGDLITYTNSASPGQILVLWASGLGADPADSDTTLTATPHAVDVSLQVFVGGVPATVLYKGASAYPGVNQINLRIPDNVPTGCYVSLAAVVGGMASNVVTLPIAKSGGVCLDVQSGLTGAQITPPPGQSLRTGLVALIASNTPGKNGARQLSNSTDAAFEKYSGLAPATHSVAPGGCIAYPLVASPIPTITGMDPGTISLTGPGGLAVTMQSTLGIKGAFFSSLSDTAIPSTGGTFTFKGSGGADVGSFTTTITLANPLLQWTNAAQAATIDKTRDFLVTWTGGNPNSYVVITGSALDSARTIQAGFTCLAPVEDGRFTIPSYILATLPSGIGGMLLQNDVYSPLSASGLDSAIALGSVGYSMTATYGAGAK